LVGINWFGIGVNYSYQYWVGDNTARKFTCFGKTADPYSTLVLSPYDDPYSISLLSCSSCWSRARSNGTANWSSILRLSSPRLTLLNQTKKTGSI
jgi:hypothetical protein